MEPTTSARRQLIYPVDRRARRTLSPGTCETRALLLALFTPQSRRSSMHSGQCRGPGGRADLFFTKTSPFSAACCTLQRRRRLFAATGMRCFAHGESPMAASTGNTRRKTGLVTGAADGGQYRIG